MIYITNEDRPGFIGRFAGLLGDASINIATFHLGRNKQGGDAIALVEVDGAVPADVLAKVQGAAAGEAGQGAGVLEARCFILASAAASRRASRITSQSSMASRGCRAVEARGHMTSCMAAANCSGRGPCRSAASGAARCSAAPMD